MTLETNRIILLALALFTAVSPVRGEEVLLHSEPPLSSPALTPATPQREVGEPPQLKFQREFFIDRTLLDSLPVAAIEEGNVPVSAARAIELVTKEADPDGKMRRMTVTELRLLKGPQTDKHPVAYYFVSVLANGSEVQRVVLMDGSVHAPKLRRVRE